MPSPVLIELFFIIVFEIQDLVAVGYDIVNTPIKYDAIINAFEDANFPLPVKRDEKGIIQNKYFVDRDEMAFKTAILAAGLNQIMSSKDTSFEFEAYNQTLKMEITHTETNDYAKIIDEKGKEYEVFKPNGT